MTEVHQIWDELTKLNDAFRDEADLGQRTTFERYKQKLILMAAASYFEAVLKEAILNYMDQQTQSVAIRNFIDKQGLERKFHTLFDWQAGNANKFFGLFGSEFKEFVKSDAKVEPLSTYIQDFVFIGTQRNLLVHNNFSTFSLVATSEEIFLKFENATKFVDWLPIGLKKFRR